MAREWKQWIWTVAIVAVATITGRADDWPQWLGPKRDGVWRETGILEKFPPGGPKVRWRVPVSEGYSGPAVAQGKVILTDRQLAQGSKNPANPFSAKDRVQGDERILCFNEADGKLLWKVEYPCPYQVSYGAGPRTTPTIDGDKVYTLGAMGDLYCVNLNNGEVVWKKNLPKEYNAEVPFWGFSGSPLVDGNRLICVVGGKGSVAVAFDKNTGKELWKNLSASEPGYASPVIYTIDGTRQLIVWHPEGVNSLDPETGKVYWSQQPFAKKYLKAGLAVPTPRLANNQLFLTSFYEGPVMLNVKGTQDPTLAWRGKGRSEQPEDTDGIHSIMPTPFIKDGHIYGICSYGELRCLKADTGERVWSTHAATTGKSVRWGNAYLVAQGDRFILFNEKGDLIIAKLSPKGYEEISRAHILEPTNTMARPPADRRVNWSHPAYANRSAYIRNDKELVCISMAAE